MMMIDLKGLKKDGYTRVLSGGFNYCMLGW